MAEEDKDSKTEEPTERRLEKAADEGQLAISQEVRNLFMLGGALIIVWLLGPWVMGGLRSVLRNYMENFAVIDLSPTGVRHLFGQLMLDVGFYLAMPLALLVALALAGSWVQTGLRFTPKKLEPKISELSMVKGFKRLFSVNSLMEFLKSLFKIVVVLIIGLVAVVPFMRSPPQMVDAALVVTLDHAHDMIVLLLAAVVIAVLLLAAVDFAWQKHQHKKQLKMSKQEMKDEFKEQEGDPQVKSKIRQLRATALQAAHDGGGAGSQRGGHQPDPLRRCPEVRDGNHGRANRRCQGARPDRAQDSRNRHRERRAHRGKPAAGPCLVQGGGNR